jgi:APA family basic amino acid/polyamine antiporter
MTAQASPEVRSTSQAHRSLSLFDCICIGINGIVGSGIYLLIAPLAKKAGYASAVGIFGCGLLCILIALCFAELGGMFDRNGGPYVYARAAFGPYVGFVVGWIAMVTGLLGWSAVSAGFAEALAKLVPFFATELARISTFAFTLKSLVAIALVLSLGIINYFGVKAGARTSDLLSVAKLLPLAAVALVGLAFVRPEVLSGMFSAESVPPSGTDRVTYWGAISSSAFLAVFMISGFEYVSVPAGEARNARHNIPLAIVGSLVGATLLYCLLQVVALSTVPDLYAREQPLMEVAGKIFGKWGVSVLGVASLVSMAGFCASTALVGPRYFTALARDGYLPQALTHQSRFRTPVAAIAVSTGLAVLLTLFLGYGSLVDVSNVALFCQYIPTCLAVLVLRYRMPNAPRAYRLPGGPLIPLAGAGISIALLATAQPRRQEWIFAGELFGLGLVIWAVTAWMRRVLTRHAAAKPADAS